MIMFMLVSLSIIAAILLWFYGAACQRFTAALQIQKWFEYLDEAVMRGGERNFKDYQIFYCS